MRLITDHQAAILAALDGRSRSFVWATEVNDDTGLGNLLHPIVRRMCERGWVEVAKREDRPKGMGGTQYVAWRLTDLGRLALKYARAERANGH